MMKRFMGILLVLSLFLTSVLLSVSAQEDDDSLSIDDFVLDGFIDTGLGLTFRYPKASNWRPAEGIEGVLGRGSVMVLDGYGAPFPRLEVFPVTSRDDLITVGREALTE
ncbi:MAG TPA: hypothetical protein PLZ51_03700, partial [Aggregatilineales bacterium]|nr:hypothetical protein [Aggregatilineales bacterium]